MSHTANDDWTKVLLIVVACFVSVAQGWMLALISSLAGSVHFVRMLFPVILFAAGPVALGVSVIERVSLGKMRIPLLLAGAGIVAIELLFALWGINIDQPGIKAPSFTLNVLFIVAFVALFTGTVSRVWGAVLHRSASS